MHRGVIACVEGSKEHIDCAVKSIKLIHFVAPDSRSQVRECLLNGTYIIFCVSHLCCAVS